VKLNPRGEEKTALKRPPTVFSWDLHFSTITERHYSLFIDNPLVAPLDLEEATGLFPHGAQTLLKDWLETHTHLVLGPQLHYYAHIGVGLPDFLHPFG
jgi:hypothetical protein